MKVFNSAREAPFARAPNYSVIHFHNRTSSKEVRGQKPEEVSKYLTHTKL